MNKTTLIARIDTIVTSGQNTLASVEPLSAEAQRAGFNPEHRWVKPDRAAQFRTSGIALLSSMFGISHPIYKDFDEGTYQRHTLESYRGPVALIQTVREQVHNGWLDDIRGLVAADIFANFLEMADYLLTEGYKDAAAVLVGSSLEAHLRALAARHGVTTHTPDKKTGHPRPKKAELLNHELQRAEAYALGDQKQVTAWLDLRNDAAHAQYHKYNVDQVKLMSAGVQNFIVRVPG